MGSQYEDRIETGGMGFTWDEGPYGHDPYDPDCPCRLCRARRSDEDDERERLADGE